MNENLSIAAIAAGAALLGSVVGALGTIWASAKTTRDAHQNQRSMYMLEKKHALYDEALTLFGTFTYGLLEDDFAIATVNKNMHAMVMRLQMFGPPSLALASVQAMVNLNALSASLTTARRGGNFDPTQHEPTFMSAQSAVEALVEEIRNDMGAS